MNKKAIAGFSLLEVMVALALLAISFTSLILVQSRATKLAIDAKKISTSTQLARYQLMECKREVQKNISMVSDFKSEGDFTELGQPDFKWECHAPRFNMKSPSASQIAESAKQVPGQKGAAKPETGNQAADLSSPIMGMITDSLGDSVRELTVIVRWKNGEIDDETRVVTHLVDLASISALQRMLAQGVKTLESQKPKGPEQPQQGMPQGQPQGQPQGGMPPGFRQGMPPGFGQPGGGMPQGFLGDEP